MSRLSPLLSLLSLAVVCVSLCLSPSHAQSSIQYIVDGGFESGNMARYTMSKDQGVSVTVLTSSSSQPSHSGKYALGFGTRGASASAMNAYVTQNLTVPDMAGDTFILSLWYMQPNSATVAQTPFKFVAYFNGQPVPVMDPSFPGGRVGTTANKGYIEYQARVVAPNAAGSTGSLTIQFNGTGAGGQVLLDDISLLGPSITGDPQFVGLRGQSYQVHGMDGEVYNLITDKSLQVNSRFVFLDTGSCPVLNGKSAKNCWTHPGSYLGAIGVQQVVDGKAEQLSIQSGDADSGFDSVILNGVTLEVGDTYTNGVFGVTFKSQYVVEVQTELFSFRFDNSDMFINQQVMANVPLSELTSHGMFGQTHLRKVYNTPLKYIAGEVDDYVVDSNDLFGTDFQYNKFMQ